MDNTGRQKERLKLSASDEVVPDRTNVNIATDRRAAKSLRLAPASQDAPDDPVSQDESRIETNDGLQHASDIIPHSAKEEEDLEQFPAVEANRGETNTGEVDEEAAAEAFEAYLPGQKRKTKKDQKASAWVIDGANVKVEQDDSGRQRRRLCTIGAFVVILSALVIAVAVGVTQSSKSSTTNTEPPKPPEPTGSPSIAPSMVPSYSPTTSPTLTPTIARFQVIVNDVARDFGPSTLLALQNFSSPQSRAARWMIDKDLAFTFPLNETDPKSIVRRRFRQRFALATLYFSTGGDSWTNPARFLSPSLHECDWGTSIGKEEPLIGCGTECTAFVVHNITTTGRSCGDELQSPTFLIMTQNNLVGSMPPELGVLTGMIGIDLAFNEITGGIPEELYNLPYLGVLGLAYNQLTGSLSGAYLKNWTYMGALSVLDNQMTGTLPSEISELTRLQVLDLTNNFFSGSIPSEWHQSISNLKTYALSNCMLTGVLPSLIEQLTRLEIIFASLNELNGTLPTELGAISTLKTINLHSNQFSGPFPEEFATSLSLRAIHLETNRLTGTLPPTAWLESKNLTDLRLALNQFTGTIPSELGSLVGLQSLTIGNPGLTGTIPTELGSLGSNLTNLYVAQCPGLQGTIPTELGLLHNLTKLNLNENDLSGTIPSKVASSPRLVQFSVWNNPRLAGTLPSSFGSPEIVWLENTNLTGDTSVICNRYQPSSFTADCLQLYCPCCTLCHVDGRYFQPFDVYKDGYRV